MGIWIYNAVKVKSENDLNIAKQFCENNKEQFYKYSPMPELVENGEYYLRFATKYDMATSIIKDLSYILPNITMYYMVGDAGEDNQEGIIKFGEGEVISVNCEPDENEIERIYHICFEGIYPFTELDKVLDETKTAIEDMENKGVEVNDKDLPF